MHPRQFSFQTYQPSSDGYRDYYGVVLREHAAGFRPGTRFEAASVRYDNAIHARLNGQTYYLGQYRAHDPVVTTGETLSNRLAEFREDVSERFEEFREDVSERVTEELQEGSEELREESEEFRENVRESINDFGNRVNQGLSGLGGSSYRLYNGGRSSNRYNNCGCGKARTGLNACGVSGSRRY